jgi:hypothetical protein
MAEEAVHCPGCRGWTPQWEHECPGIGTSLVQLVVTRLPWLRILTGRTLTVNYKPGQEGG